MGIKKVIEAGLKLAKRKKIKPIPGDIKYKKDLKSRLKDFEGGVSPPSAKKIPKKVKQMSRKRVEKELKLLNPNMTYEERPGLLGGFKKGGEVKKRKPTKEELNKIMKTGGGGKRAKEIIENLLAPIKNLPKGVMKTGGVRNVSKLPATQATPATPAIPMKRPRRRTGMTKGIDPTGQPRRLTERERLRMIKQGGRYKKRAAVHRMPDGTIMKGAKHGMKHGGSVKGKCKVDGIAIRGRTKAKHK